MSAGLIYFILYNISSSSGDLREHILRLLSGICIACANGIVLIPNGIAALLIIRVKGIKVLRGQTWVDDPHKKVLSLLSCFFWQPISSVTLSETGLGSVLDACCWSAGCVVQKPLLF